MCVCRVYVFVFFFQDTFLYPKLIGLGDSVGSEVLGGARKKMEDFKILRDTYCIENFTWIFKHFEMCVYTYAYIYRREKSLLRPKLKQRILHFVL